MIIDKKFMINIIIKYMYEIWNSTRSRKEMVIAECNTCSNDQNQSLLLYLCIDQHHWFPLDSCLTAAACLSSAW